MPPSAPPVAVNQAGYLPDFPKHARVVASARAQTFEVRREDDGRVVLAGRLAEARHDVDAGEQVQLADFSTVRAIGRYRVRVPGVGDSVPFDIGPAPFDRALSLATRAFYGQRCGTAVDLGPGVDGYRHAICHTATGRHASAGGTSPAGGVGGWHDAGDYGRYVVTSGISTGLLLLAADLSPGRMHSLRLDLPDTRPGTPDLLQEVRWTLDWLLRMQGEDGGVWHKQTSAQFAGVVLPEHDAQPSLVIGTGRAPYASTCATAQVAAATAAGARVFRAHDPPYADRLLDAARRAWTWTQRFPDEVFLNPADVGTGAYDDAACGDEQLWAAVELWRATREPTFADEVAQRSPSFLWTLRATGPPTWAQVGALALWGYALDRPPADETLHVKVRQQILDAAAAVAARVHAHPSRHPLTTDDFVWGSNGVAATYGLQLLVAHRIAPSRPLVEAALDTLHYLLGRNPFALSWLTHVGPHAVRHLHHRPSMADAMDAPWPGLLAGGPNRHREDPVLAALPVGPPGRAYVDDEALFASNESAINWNAALVGLLAGAADAAELDPRHPSR